MSAPDIAPAGVTAVFGGGGAKAAAHIGAMRALEEAGIRPAHFLGTSMGSVFAAMFAAGLNATAVLDRLSLIDGGKIVQADRLAFLQGLWAKSLLKAQPFRASLTKLLPAHRFEDLRWPLSVTATALENGALTIFGAGGRSVPLVDALYASCALPVFLPPAIIEGVRYGDGGLRAVLPLEAAAVIPARLVVVVDVGPGFDEAPGARGSGLPPVVEAHSESIGILMAGQTAQALALYRASSNRPPLLYVRPRVERGATFRVDRMQHYVEEGFRATSAALAGLNSGAG